MPSQGPRHERLTLIFDLAVLALTSVLVWWLRQPPGRHRGIGVLVDFSVPLVVALVALGVPAWKAFFLFEPDLGYWLYGVAAALFAKGLFDLAAMRHARTHFA